ncbi:hypothetical protein 9S3_69 [uncultured Caudovirales phage]|uniref:Uncharacterized protein n=1 Tax=uncultured Caudovirales phage TaxID=2100421 RepID=A0A2H4JB79_9CAUD|nr:hypothetical protein 9S3_69 [uncultured Caudovirales phage]
MLETVKYILEIIEEHEIDFYYTADYDAIYENGVTSFTFSTYSDDLTTLRDNVRITSLESEEVKEKKVNRIYEIITEGYSN